MKNFHTSYFKVFKILDSLPLPNFYMLEFYFYIEGGLNVSDTLY